MIHVYTFTTDVDSYMQLEEGVVRPYFGEHPPPSTVVQVARLIDPAWLVEVRSTR